MVCCETELSFIKHFLSFIVDIRKKLPWISPGGLTPSYPVSYTPNTMLHSGHHSQGFSHSNQMGISQQKVDRSDRVRPMLYKLFT